MKTTSLNMIQGGHHASQMEKQGISGYHLNKQIEENFNDGRSQISLEVVKEAEEDA